MLNRRLLLVLMLLGLGAQGMPALAKDGNSGGGNSGSGNSGSGNSGSGGDDDSDGDGNSGKGNDDKRDDDKREDDEPDEDDDEKIRDAVAAGLAEPLRNILSSVRRLYKGEVVSIRLMGRGRNLQYRIRIIDTSSRLVEVRVNAKTGSIIGTASP